MEKYDDDNFETGFVNGTSFVGGTNQQAVNSLINHLNNTFDYVPD